MFKADESLTRYLMRPYGWHLFFASVCSLLLGLIASFLVTLIGPSVLALIGTDGTSSLPLSGLLGEKPALFVQQFFPDLSVVKTDDIFFYLPLALVVVAFFKALLQFFSWFTWEWLAEGMAGQLRHMIVNHYLHVAPEKRAEAKEEEIASVLATDCKLFREYIVHFYGGFPRELIQIIFMLATQFLLSARLTLIFFLGIAPIGFLMSYLGKKVRKRSTDALENYSSLTEWLQQRLLGLETIKHYRSEELEIKHMQARSLSLTKDLIRAARSKAKTAPLVQFFAACSVVVVLTIALIEVQKETLSGAVALSFFSSVALLIQSAGVCGRYYNSNREAAAALKRIKGLLLGFDHIQRQQVGLSNATHSAEQDICFALKNVYARHRGQESYVLNNFSYQFEKNKIYAVTGPSGSGKSTLFQVILGLLPIEKGSLVCSFTEDNNIGYMPQNLDLISGTVAQQVCYPEETYDEKRVIQALDKVGLLPFIQSQQKGIHTAIGSEGSVFSGGQNQRLLLARLFYAPKPLILIDEGTSALDPVTEKDFYESLKKLVISSTIIMIAHRPAALDHCDAKVEML